MNSEIKFEDQSDQLSKKDNSSNFDANSFQGVYRSNFGCGGCLYNFIIYIALTIVFLYIVSILISGLVINGFNNYLVVAFWMTVLTLIIRPFLAISFIPIIRGLVVLAAWVVNSIALLIIGLFMPDSAISISFFGVVFSGLWLAILQVGFENIKLYIRSRRNAK